MNTVFSIPEIAVYLDEGVLSCLAAKSDAKGVDLSDRVNDLSKREIEIIEAIR